MRKNIESFIGCDAEYIDAKVVIFGAPFDSTTSYRPGARFGSSAIRHESYGLETSPVMDEFFPSYTRLIYSESSEQLWDFVLLCRLIHSHKPWYQVSVRRVRCLPTASFRFHLTMDTLAFGCSLPTVRAAWGLAPVRIRSCWANTRKSETSSH